VWLKDFEKAWRSENERMITCVADPGVGGGFSSETHFGLSSRHIFSYHLSAQPRATPSSSDVSE
jgi:hypothetical protein